MSMHIRDYYWLFFLIFLKGHYQVDAKGPPQAEALNSLKGSPAIYISEVTKTARVHNEPFSWFLIHRKNIVLELPFTPQASRSAPALRAQPNR